MQIIKGRQIVADNWHYVADNEPPPKGNITVSLSRWLSEQQTLLARDGDLGLRLNPQDPIDSVAEDLQKFKLIELNFPTFADGRSFSQAWLLKNRYQFNGELRAVGGFLRDQLFYLYRVGFNSFALENSDCLQEAISSLEDFSVTYQESTR